MIGATIGAGVGPYQGLHGLVIDALRSVRLVTASGDIVTASDEENPDLFWAVRGAGANFGIITSATYEIFDAPNNGNVVLAEFAYPGSVNGSLWQLLESWGETYPKEMGLTMSASYSQTTGTVRVSILKRTTSYSNTTLGTTDLFICLLDLLRDPRRRPAMDRSTACFEPHAVA
jgi:hypothetical protein